MNKIVNPFVRFFERWMPDALIFAIFLTVVSLVAVPILTNTSFLGGIDAFGGGMWDLLAFTTQLATTMVTGYALANTPISKKFFVKLANIPKNSFQVYLFITFVTAIANLVSWSLGLVAGAVLAIQMAKVMKEKGIKIHYPLLVASAYAGFVIWELGLTSSIALSIATPEHPFEAVIGIIPTSETIFSAWNITVALIVAFTLPVVMALLRPKNDDEIVEMENVSEVAATIEVGAVEETAARRSPAAFLENFIGLNWILGLIGLYLFFNLIGDGLSVNTINLFFLTLTILLTKSPMQLVRLINDGARTMGPFILQYPIYAGIMGVLAATGLGDVLAESLIGISTENTLPLFTFLSAGLLNIFVPSGGGQWAIQAPIVLEAAKSLGVDPWKIAMAVAYGDGWTNMIQPFWALPLLAIAGIKVGKIMGYLVAAFLWSGLIFTIAFLII